MTVKSWNPVMNFNFLKVEKDAPCQSFLPPTKSGNIKNCKKLPATMLSS